MAQDRSDEVRAVDRGVKLLDKQNPYWAMGLGVIGDYFDINDKHCCVLGWAYGRFERGFYKLTGHAFDEDNPDDIKWAIDHGFWVSDQDYSDDEDVYYGRAEEQYRERSDRLTKSWLKRIKARVERIEKGSKFGLDQIA